MKLEKVLTRDGSATLRVVEWDETFHSRHGAVGESVHVYQRHGLEKAIELKHSSGSLRVLEMGFGSGLNAFLAARLMAGVSGVVMDYVSIDKFPLDTLLTHELDYAGFIGNSELSATFRKLNEATWNRPYRLESSFLLTKLSFSLEDYFPQEKFDVLLYDAFGPRVQPELWTESCFRHVSTWLHPGAFMVTYCAKGNVKRALRSAGFRVETLPGPPGKREMIRAWKGNQ